MVGKRKQPAFKVRRIDRGSNGLKGGNSQKNIWRENFERRRLRET
jgi:hypothetical protein